MRTVSVIDSLARDVAFEIQLGGDRFDASDLARVLEGIGKDDLEVFRSRVMLHSKDFAPSNPNNERFVSKELDYWLSGVRTSESMGKGPTDWFANENLSDDKGKYFLFYNGSVLKCEKATAQAMWGDEVKDIAKEMTTFEVAERYYDMLDEKDGFFVSYSGLPEGRIVSIGKEYGEKGFHFEDGSFVSLDMAVRSHPSIVIDILESETEERLYREVALAQVRRQDVSDFRLKAGQLIDCAGERVMRDFLYDQAVVRSNESGTVYVCRDVDDLRDHSELGMSILVVSGKTRKLTSVTEDIDAGFLNKVSEAVDDRLKEVMTQNGFLLGNGRVDFPDGPVVNMQYVDWDGRCFTQMKVDSLQTDEAGLMVVVGRYVNQDGELGDQLTYPLSKLSDKSVWKIREATGSVLNLLQHASVELKPVQPQVARKAGKKGVDM